MDSVVAGEKEVGMIMGVLLPTFSIHTLFSSRIYYVGSGIFFVWLNLINTL